MQFIDSSLPYGDELYMGKHDHKVQRVVLRSGEVWAVDIGGAQFGYPGVIMPWDEYEKRRILAILNLKAAHTPECYFNTDDYSAEAIDKLDKKMKRQIHVSWVAVNTKFERTNLYIMELQTGEGLSFKDMWKLPEGEFLKKRDDLVNFLEWKFAVIPIATYVNFPAAFEKGEHVPSTVNGKRLKKQIGGRWREWVHNKS
jgi:hypothetical protein